MDAVSHALTRISSLARGAGNNDTRCGGGACQAASYADVSYSASKAQFSVEDVRMSEELDRTQREVERRLQEAESLRKAEQASLTAAQELWRQAKEAERAFREEKGRYEQLKQERETIEKAEASRREKATRLSEESHDWLRKATVVAFLQERGFDGVGSPKYSLMSTTYPLHTAAEEGNARVLAMLLREGANPAQLDSSSRTAAQVAQEKNRSGSHNRVLQILRKVSAPRFGGA